MIETEKLQTVADRGAGQFCIDPACSARFELNERLYVCPSCGDLLDVAPGMAANFDPEVLRSRWTARLASFDPLDRSGVWRYRELLSFATDAPIVTLAEGNTPLYEAPVSADYCGLDTLRSNTRAAIQLALSKIRA